MQKPLIILSSMASRQILAGLTDSYHAHCGTEVVVRAMGGVEVAKLVRLGEPADLILLAGSVMAVLETEGFVKVGSVVPFAQSGIAVAVREGAVNPHIGDAAAARDAMLGARAIGYSTGPSGDYLESLWGMWGIDSTVRPRSIKAKPGVPVAVLLARGEVDLGFQQLSEMIGQPGIDIVGPLPPDIQQLTTFSIGLSRTSNARVAAEKLVAFLTSHGATATKIGLGMTAPVGTL